jgi:hypothetical protein
MTDHLEVSNKKMQSYFAGSSLFGQTWLCLPISFCASFILFFPCPPRKDLILFIHTELLRVHCFVEVYTFEYHSLTRMKGTDREGLGLGLGLACRVHKLKTKRLFHDMWKLEETPISVPKVELQHSQGHSFSYCQWGFCASVAKGVLFCAGDRT